MIYLKDHIETVFEECVKRNEPGYHYSKELIRKAIDAQIKDNLRYHNGKTYCKNFGVASEYTNKHDIPKYENPTEAARWEFSGMVRNSASRMSRGLTAI